MALLEEVCHGSQVLGSQKLMPDLVAQFSFLLHMDPAVELSATSPALWLPACHHALIVAEISEL